MFFFFSFYFHEFYEALKTDESFIDLQRRGAHSTKGKRQKRIAVVDQPSHPDVDTLHDYVLGDLNNKQMREVMDHLSKCEECVGKASEIRRLDKEITKDFQHYMRTSVSEPKDPSSDDPI